MSDFLLEYQFSNLLFPQALRALGHARTLGRPVVLSDGDVVFQPRKIKHAGIWSAVDGAVLIYIHKEKVLDHVQLRYPASHYVMVDDKPNLLASMKSQLGDRLTTVFVRQGHYALAPGSNSVQPPADRVIERIGEMLNSQFIRLRGATMSMTQKLHDLGQSLWLDNITRDILDNGTLRRYIDELSVTGLTSNPTIFDEAIGGSSLYDDSIRKKAQAGASGEGLFVDLALEDLRRAADLFRPSIRPHRRHRRLGLHGGVPAARQRYALDHRGCAQHPQARRPAQPVREDPRHAGGRSCDRGGHFRGRARERHPAVLA